MITAEAANFYVTGGTLRLDAPSYIERRADTELCLGLKRGEFCYVLTTRQMGKSSLMVRTATQLKQEGCAVAVLDLTAIGQNLTPEQWYDGLLTRLGQQLDLEDELEDFWLDHDRLSPVQRWMAALEKVVLPKCPGHVVIFIDEIDAIRSVPFSTDEFFAAIRECYNRRALEPEWDRLNFCLLGVASPTDLIRDPRTTPFNIGRRVILTDFAESEAMPLTKGLGREPAQAKTILKRILFWTGGHPYLTQRFCHAVSADQNIQSQKDVDSLCRAMFLSEQARERDDNLIFVRERLLKSDVDVAALLDIYSQILQGKRVEDDEAHPLVTVLRLSGVVRGVNGRLMVRNRIYECVFDRRWIKENMPGQEIRRQTAAYRRGMSRAAAFVLTTFGVFSGSFFLWVRSLNQDPFLQINVPAVPTQNGFQDYLAASGMVAGEEALNRTRPELPTQAYATFTPASVGPEGTGDRTPTLTLGEKRALIGRYKQALETVKNGFRREAVWPPDTARDVRNRYPVEFLNLAQLLRLKGEVLEAQGDFAGAADAYLDMARLGEDVARGGPLVTKIVSDVIVTTGLSKIMGITDRLNSHQTRQVIERLEKIRDRHIPLSEAYQQEKWITQADLMTLFRRPGWRSSFLAFLQGRGEEPRHKMESVSSFLLTLPRSETEILQDYTKRMDEQIERSRRPFSGKEAPIAEDQGFLFGELYPRFSTPRTGSPYMPQESEVRVRSLSAFVLLDLAIRAYLMERGRLPQTLSDLVPDSIKSVPYDPATHEETLGYSRSGNRYILFSTQYGYNPTGKGAVSTGLDPIWKANVGPLPEKVIKWFAPLPGSSKRPPHKGLRTEIHRFKEDTGGGGTNAPGPELWGPILKRRIDPYINYTWNLGPPGKNLPDERFIIRWSGQILAPRSGLYHFQISSDDGVRLFINDQKIIDKWTDHAVENSDADVYLQSGWHKFQLHYYDRSQDAIVRLRWNYPMDGNLYIIPPRYFGH